MAKRKPPPPELTPEARVICDVMGWGYETDDRFDPGNVALMVVRDLAAAGWRLYQIPGDYS